MKHDIHELEVKSFKQYYNACDDIDLNKLLKPMTKVYEDDFDNFYVICPTYTVVIKPFGDYVIIPTKEETV